MEKAAVALFVKDEVYDIAGWISWYVAIGFDKIYIYDDHSIDGTYEVCLAASSLYNIEVFKTDIKKETDFFWRQRDSYFDACKRAEGKYEWIAFLDADEYISLDGPKNIKEFLNKFENFNAIALNWCIYGSSSRAIKDHVPVYDAFISHSTPELGDNRLVKSIIRPNFFSFRYTDPHRFYMNDESYADSLGKSFEWDGANKKVLWEEARINHYICRSMEHYVSRIKRRIGSDLHNSVVYWDHLNRNDIIEGPKSVFSERANVSLSNIKENIIEKYISEIRNHNAIPPYSDNDSSVKIYDVIDSFGKMICLNNIDGHLISDGDIGNIKHKVYGVKYENENSLYLVSIVNGVIQNIYYHISDYNKKSYCYKFDLVPNDDGTFLMKNHNNDKYLCSIPEGQINNISCNRIEPSEWEKFTLVETNLDAKFGSNVFSGTKFEDFIAYICSDFRVYTNDFYVSASNLSLHDIEKLKNDKNKILSWIL